MSCRAQLVIASLGSHERRLSFVNALLIEERLAENQLGGTDLVKDAFASFQEFKRFPGLRFRLCCITSLELHSGKRGDGIGGIQFTVDLQRRTERLLKKLHRLVRPPE